MSGNIPRWKHLVPKPPEPAAVARIAAAWVLAEEQQIENLLERRDYAAASSALLKAIARADKNGSPAAKIELRLKLAMARRKQGANDSHSIHLRAAEKIVRQAIAVAAHEQQAHAYLDCLDELAEIFEAQANWPAAVSSLRQAVKIQTTERNPNRAACLLRFRKLAMAEHTAGNLDSALEAAQEALDLAKIVYKPEDVELGHLLADTGRLLRSLGNHEEAQECLRNAIRIHRMRLTEGSQEVLSDLQQLAGSLEESGDLDGAAREYEKCLSIKQRQLGLVHIDELGLMQFSLANVYISWGNLARARELLQEAIGAFRPAGGARLAVAHEMLAQLEEASGRYGLAIRELEAAGKAWERCGTDRIRELIRNMEYRADLLVEIKRIGEASWLQEKIQRLSGHLAELEGEAEPQSENAARLI